MNKRIISGLAAVALTFSGAGTALANVADLHFEVAASAAEAATSGTCGENLTWTLDEEGTLTISGTGDMADYSFITDTPWYNNRNIKKVIIGDGVTRIGNNAFYGFKNPESIDIPDSVTSIGTSAFAECAGLKSVTIPDSITVISRDTFSGCSNLESVTLPNGLTSIGTEAFSSCKRLKNITIPDGVTIIGNYAFFFCTSLSSISIPESVTRIGHGAFFNCNFLKRVTIPKSLTDIGGHAFKYTLCMKAMLAESPLVVVNNVLIETDISLSGDVTVPDGVTIIGEEAFSSRSEITNVTIPDSVTRIEPQAFTGCSDLESVTIPNSVQRIGAFAFGNCKNLKCVTIPSSVTHISDNALGYSASGYYSYSGKGKYTKIEDFKIICCKNTAAEKYAIDNGFKYELIDDPTVPTVNKVEWNEEFHQFRMKWNEVEGATQYGIAVKIANKWKVQAYTDKNYFTSPKLRPGSIAEMVVCAKVNGKWDTNNLNGRAFKVEVK